MREAKKFAKVTEKGRGDNRILLSVFRLKTGDGDLQAVVVDRNLIPAKSMQFLVDLFQIRTWFR